METNELLHDANLVFAARPSAVMHSRLCQYGVSSLYTRQTSYQFVKYILVAKSSLYSVGVESMHATK